MTVAAAMPPDDAKSRRGKPRRGASTPPSELSLVRQKREAAQRSEAMSLLMAGLTYEQIADRLGVERHQAQALIERMMADRPDEQVALRRKVENARLDRAQAAIWGKVLEGDHKAIQSFLSISARRSRLNGMDAPLQIQVSAHVKMEMEHALSELQGLVLGDEWQAEREALEAVVDAEVIDDADFDEEGPASSS